MHSILFRLLAAAPLCALAACATDSARKADVDSLRAELRSLRDNNARLEQRLERLEVRDTVSRAKANAAPAPAAAPAPSSKAEPTPSLSATPELAVVKLKPRNEPAPPIATRVAVEEPAADDMEAFISGSDSEDSTPARPRRQARGAKEAREAKEVREPVQELTQADADYEQAVSALRTGNVEGGVARLQRFAEENPRNPRADNALYFSGLGLIGLKDFASAARVFERLIETYPAGDAVVDGLLRLAECKQRLNQTEDARALYTRLVTQFPGTAAATQAEQRLATLSH